MNWDPPASEEFAEQFAMMVMLEINRRRRERSCDDDDIISDEQARELRDHFDLPSNRKD